MQHNKLAKYILTQKNVGQHSEIEETEKRPNKRRGGVTKQMYSYCRRILYSFN